MWNETSVLVSNLTATQEMKQYYRDIYPETCPQDDQYIHYSWQDYVEHICAMIDHTLIVPHPYPKIESEKYYVNPELLNSLNDKSQLDQLHSQIPDSKLISNHEACDITDFPTVLKTKTWASGDGVIIAYNATELYEKLWNFPDNCEFMWEEFIETKKNYNLQFMILANWTIKYIWCSLQNVDTDWEYKGNIIMKDMLVPGEVLKIWKEACTNAHDKWFYWICWLDILESVDNRFYLIDPNFRLNWSTAALMLKEKIFSETGWEIMQFWSFVSKHWSFSETVNESMLLVKQGVYLVSCLQAEENWEVWWYAVTVWNDMENLKNKHKFLAKKWFIF